ncbi:hypothetical protein V6N13_115892 [Hibiscus sabdariffa]
MADSGIMSIKILNFLPKSNHPSSSAPAATTVVKANIDADSSKTLLISSQFDPEKAITPLLPRASSYNSTSNLNNNSIVSFANNHQQRSRRISSDSYLRCDSLPVNSEKLPSTKHYEHCERHCLDEAPTSLVPLRLKDHKVG